jgi:hypothetical protein
MSTPDTRTENPKTPLLRGLGDAGGGTRTPDTRIMMACLEAGLPVVTPG